MRKEREENKTINQTSKTINQSKTYGGGWFKGQASKQASTLCALVSVADPVCPVLRLCRKGRFLAQELCTAASSVIRTQRVRERVSACMHKRKRKRKRKRKQKQKEDAMHDRVWVSAIGKRPASHQRRAKASVVVVVLHETMAIEPLLFFT